MKIDTLEDVWNEKIDFEADSEAEEVWDRWFLENGCVAYVEQKKIF